MPTLSLMFGAFEDEDIGFMEVGRAPPRNRSGRWALISWSINLRPSVTQLMFGIEMWPNCGRHQSPGCDEFPPAHLSTKTLGLEARRTSPRIQSSASNLTQHYRSSPEGIMFAAPRLRND